MDHDSVVEQIVRSLSFEVEAVPQDNIIQVTTTSKSAPLNVKIRVRKKDEAGFQRGVLSLAKPNQVDTIPERIRLVSSDQTIMSFNVVMEADFDKPVKKPRKNILGIFKPTICLGAEPDEDHYAYLPSSTDKAEINEESTSKSDGALTKRTLSKNVDISPELSKRKRNIFGKCKPGGCLDPPFGEEKYPYIPKTEDEKPSNVKTATKARTSSMFSNNILTWKRKGYDDQGSDNNVIQIEKKTESVLDLYQAGSLQTSATYSNSIITYPPTLNSSELRIQEERRRDSKTLNTISKNSFSVQSGSYFMLPKKPKNLVDKRDTVKLKDEDIVRGDISKVAIIKSKSIPKVDNDGIHHLQKDDKFGNISNIAMITRKSEPKKDISAVQYNNLNKNDVDALKTKVSTTEIRGSEEFLLIFRDSNAGRTQCRDETSQKDSRETIGEKNREKSDPYSLQLKTNNDLKYISTPLTPVEYSNISQENLIDVMTKVSSDPELIQDINNLENHNKEIKYTKKLLTQENAVRDQKSSANNLTQALKQIETENSNDNLWPLRSTDISFSSSQSQENKYIERFDEKSHLEMDILSKSVTNLNAINKIPSKEYNNVSSATTKSPNINVWSEKQYDKTKDLIEQSQLFGTHMDNSKLENNNLTATVQPNLEANSGDLLKPILFVMNDRSNDLNGDDYDIKAVRQLKNETKECETILPSALTLDARHEMATYDLMATYDEYIETKNTIQDETKEAAKYLEDEGSATNIPSPIEKNTLLDTLRIENGDLEQIWKNRTQPLESDMQFHEVNKQIDYYQNNVDTLVEGNDTENTNEISLSNIPFTESKQKDLRERYDPFGFESELSHSNHKNTDANQNSFDSIITYEKNIKSNENILHKNDQEDNGITNFNMYNRNDDSKETKHNKNIINAQKLQINYSDNGNDDDPKDTQRDKNIINAQQLQANDSDNRNDDKKETTHDKNIINTQLLQVNDSDNSNDDKKETQHDKNTINAQLLRVNDLDTSYDDNLQEIQHDKNIINAQQLQVNDSDNSNDDKKETQHDKNTIDAQLLRVNDLDTSYDDDLTKIQHDKNIVNAQLLQVNDSDNSNDDKKETQHDKNTIDAQLLRVNDLDTSYDDDLTKIQHDKNIVNAQLLQVNDSDNRNDNLKETQNNKNIVTAHQFQVNDSNNRNNDPKEKKHDANFISTQQLKVNVDTKTFEIKTTGANNIDEHKHEKKITFESDTVRTNNKTISPILSEQTKSSLIPQFDSDLKSTGREEILSVNEVAGFDGINIDATNKSSQVPVSDSKNSTVFKINLGLQSYVEDNNEVIVKSFDLDKTPERYLNDTINVTTRYLKMDNEIKIPINSSNNLCIQIKSSQPKDIAGVKGLKLDENAETVEMGKTASGSANKKENDSIQRNLFITDDIKRTLVAVYEDELLPLRNTIAELRENMEMLSLQHTLLKGHMFIKKQRPSRIVPLYRKCGCMRR